MDSTNDIIDSSSMNTDPVVTVIITTNEETKTFCNLPREIRNEIYGYVLTYDKPIKPQVIWPSNEEALTATLSLKDPLAPENLTFYHQEEYLGLVPEEEAYKYFHDYEEGEEDPKAKPLSTKAKAVKELAETLYKPRGVLVRTDKHAVPDMRGLTALSLSCHQLYSEVPTKDLYALNIIDFGAHYPTMQAYLISLSAKRPAACKTLPLKLRFHIRFNSPAIGPNKHEAYLFSSLAMLVRWGPQGWGKEHCFGDVMPILRLRFTNEDLEKHWLPEGYELVWAADALAQLNISLKLLERTRGSELKKLRDFWEQDWRFKGVGTGPESEIDHSGDVALQHGDVMHEYFPFTWAALDQKQDRDPALKLVQDSALMDVVPCGEHCGCLKSAEHSGLWASRG